ncbi:hypothetical protein QEN19_001103 [Hanseniaspora menglaensis]
MQNILSFLSSGGKNNSSFGNETIDSQNANNSQKHADEVRKTPTNRKAKKIHYLNMPEGNSVLNFGALNLEKLEKGNTTIQSSKLNKNLQVLIKVKPMFAEEEEEAERKEKFFLKGNPNSSIMKQQLKDLFKDLDSILEVPSESVICYKGISVTQQMHLQQQSNSRDYIMSNPIASPNNSRYNRDRVLEFDHVFNKDDNDITKLYDTWIAPQLEDANIENLNIFTYGSTGCGKTFTIQKILNNLLDDVFQSSNIKIKCSYMEIYNDKVRDLLTNNINGISSNDLFIREDFQGFQCIDGLSVHDAYDIKQLKEIVQYGHDQRFTEETNLNKRSSRSHSILTISVKSENLNKNFTIVDLAGSERASKAQNKGLRLKEGAMINKSLLALANCINSLTSEGGNKHVPFRDSKLTRLLKHVLTADDVTRTVMIACVSGILRNKDETLNTLMYAKRCMGINNEFQHLNFSANNTANDSVTAPTISTLTRVRSASVKKNESKVLSRAGRVPSVVQPDKKVTKKRAASSNIFNSKKTFSSRNSSRHDLSSINRQSSFDPNLYSEHESCQSEIQSWKEKFLKITNELNAFTNAGNILSEHDNKGFSFLKHEFINPKVLLYLEKSSWQMVKNSLSNLLTIYNKDQDIMMRNIILGKISNCNEKLYQVQKLMGNSSSLLRELELLTLSKGIVLSQLDILSKVVESEIYNDFSVAEESFIAEHYNTLFNFFDNLDFISKNENNLRTYLDHKLQQVVMFVSFLKDKNVNSFVMSEFNFDQKYKDKNENDTAENIGNLSVIKHSQSEMSVAENESFPSTSSALAAPQIVSSIDQLHVLDSSVLSDEGDKENMAQEINIQPELNFINTVSATKTSKRRLHINKGNSERSLGVPQRVKCANASSQDSYKNMAVNNTENLEITSEDNEMRLKLAEQEKESKKYSSAETLKDKTLYKKKGIISLLNNDTSVE